MYARSFQSGDKKAINFKIKGSDALGVIKLVTRPDDIDDRSASTVLVESFIGEYQQYLRPDEVGASLNSWREGDLSVEKYYENYFIVERKAFVHGEVDFWVEATVNGKLAGWATFQREKANPNAIYMNLLAVHPQFQKMGIGEQLVKSLLNLNVIPELSAVNLLLRQKNKGGRIFYKKLGFVTNPDYQRDDNFVDMSLLEGLTWNNPAFQNKDVMRAGSLVK